MKKWFVFMIITILSIQLVNAQTVSEDPSFLEGFSSFAGLATLIIPAIIGWINDKLSKPMNKWITYLVTFLVSVAVTYFSWYFELGFPPANTSWWIVLINAIFLGLASTGIVSILISEWLAELISNKNKDNK